MKQIFQNLKSGQQTLEEIPAPAAKPGNLLIETRISLISPGTERMLISFAKSGLINKARQQPEKVKQVIEKIKTDGLKSTLSSVNARLDEPLPLGYSNCGIVLEIGKGVEGFKVGDRVVSNGPHAGVVCVPKNLCAKIPENVSDDQAAFTVLSSIGLQGIRLMKPELGENIVVFGLGLIGLICVQLLKACGCNVIGIDINKQRLQLAEEFGAQIINAQTESDTIQSALSYSSGKGVDGVLITASAKNDSIVHQATTMSRKRGRIVLIGVVDLKLNRSDFYEKELTFQVSCSYGPGRYDDNYERNGVDYPYGYVRWTEQRNFEAMLNSIASGSLNVDRLISKRVSIIDAQDAYEKLAEDPKNLAILLTYPSEATTRNKTIKIPGIEVKSNPESNLKIGLIGVGNFAKLTLLPSIKSLNVELKSVADPKGNASAFAAKKFGFERCTNDYNQIIEDSDINTIIITTRHDMHASMVIAALRAGKHVFVEKPLCLNKEELIKIRSTLVDSRNQHLLVGFNRRFSPHAQKMRELVKDRTNPITMSVIVNAGAIPSDHWVQKKEIGGGRIIGEGCHWLDLMAYIIEFPISEVSAVMSGNNTRLEICEDKMTITLKFSDGSIGTLHYFANGHKSYPKESVRVFCNGKILELDNFRKLRGFGWSRFKKMNLFSQDKGHQEEFRQFFDRIRTGGEPLMPFDQIENVTKATFASLESNELKKVVFI